MFCWCLCFLALTLVTQTLQNWFCHLCFCQQLLEFSPWSHTLCSQAEEALLLKTGPEVHSHWHTQCCQYLFLLNSSCISSSSSWKMIVVLFFIFGQKKLPLGLYIFYLRNSGGTESKPTLESVVFLGLGRSTDHLRAYLGCMYWKWGCRRRTPPQSPCLGSVLPESAGLLYEYIF